jgi:hypothetical protein
MRDTAALIAALESADGASTREQFALGKECALALGFGIRLIEHEEGVDESWRDPEGKFSQSVLPLHSFTDLLKLFRLSFPGWGYRVASRPTFDGAAPGCEVTLVGRDPGPSGSARTDHAAFLIAMLRAKEAGLMRPSVADGSAFC